MSIVFSMKNKKKRSRSSSSDTDNSFVKNVTSKMSGLLPTTITKWFSSPSTSNANGSAPTADATDSSTEDEAPESPVQPPATKRMRYCPPGNFNHYKSNETNCITSNIETIEVCNAFNSVQSPPGRSTFTRETSYASTPIRSPSEESTSERTERDNTVFKSQHVVTSIGNSVANKRKSLFENDSPLSSDASIRACVKTSCNTVRDPKQPCFKPSLLGSPFYPGRTMYGGAASSYINQPNIKQRKTTVVNEVNSNDNNTMSYSARRIMDLLEHYSSPLLDAKRIPQYTKNPKNKSSNTNYSLAPQADRVRSYRSQELHVPSIASIFRLKQKSRLMDTTNAARQIIASHSSTNTANFAPYPSVNTQRDEDKKETNSGFTTKVISRLTRPKRGGDSDLQATDVAPLNLPTAVLQIDHDNLPKFTLGTSVISKPLTSSTSTSSFSAMVTKPVSEAKTITKETEDESSSKPEEVINNKPYTFASPVSISNEPPHSTTTLLRFTFGSPDRSIDQNNVNKKKEDVSSPCVEGTPKVIENNTIISQSKDWKCPDCWVSNKVDVDKCVCCGYKQQSKDNAGTQKVIEKNTIVSQSKDWKCPDCWVSNKADIDKCVCCGYKQPSKDNGKPVKCSVCKIADSQTHVNKCVNCEKIQVNNISKLPVAKTTDSSKWKCGDCCVNSAEKCVCRGGNNPKKSIPVEAKTLPSNNENEWKCNDCWIKNKNSLDQCAACGASKPGAKQSNQLVNTMAMTSNKQADSSFKNIIKIQSDKWECSNCLVRNDNDKAKCICCETDKPGTVKESSKKSFNFGINANTFKFGIDPKMQVSNSDKQTETKSSDNDKSMVKESETNNNILAKTPAVIFNTIPKKPEDETDVAKEKITEPPKPNFTFGIPKQLSSATTSSALPVFGTTKLPDTIQINAELCEEKEKPQEVPKVNFALPTTQESSKPLTGLFDSPVTSQAATEKSSSSATLTNEEKKNILNSNLVPLQTTATSSEAIPQQATFTFSGAGIKPAINLFGSPATAATTTISFASPLQTISTISTSSLFQKSEPTTSAVSLFQPPLTTASPVSLFQKPEATVTSVPPAPASTAPVFSFLSSSQNVQPQTEKPKFEFTFGSNNKSDSSSVFKPTFGVATDNTQSTNKFTLATGNVLVGSNGQAAGNNLTGDSLPGSNGLSNNLLGSGSVIATNPLSPSNELNTGSNLPSASSTGLFGTQVQKENMWSSNNNASSNLFVSNASTNSLQKPTFTFGSSMPFNANNTTPTFGNNAQSTPNVFGMSNRMSNGQPSMFPAAVQNQTTPNIFGSPQPGSNSTPSLGIFGTPNVGATPTFGTPNASIPSFETPSLTPAPAPAFNFGAPQTVGVFGFGQQAGVYNFGASGGTPNVQFNMGTAPNTTVRKMRKALRRNPQR